MSGDDDGGDGNGNGVYGATAVEFSVPTTRWFIVRSKAREKILIVNCNY